MVAVAAEGAYFAASDLAQLDGSMTMDAMTIDSTRARC